MIDAASDHVIGHSQPASNNAPEPAFKTFEGLWKASSQPAPDDFAANPVYDTGN